MNFLESVADCYVSRAENTGSDLASHTFVCPNKRSAMFLKRYIQRRLRSVSFMPRFVTMGRFVASLSLADEPDRREQLFLLYNVYNELLRRRGREGQIREFDRFVYWGETILNDFDDIDMSMVDASQLFKNLIGIKEINADYLTDEQKQAIRQIWGPGAVPDSLTDFWTHTGKAASDCDSDDGVTHKFLSLWELLGELYVDFRQALLERGMMSRGMQYRAAADYVNAADIEQLRQRCYVFVGFNDFSNSEIRMLRRLKDASAAEFVWDFMSPDFFIDDGRINLDNHATRAIADLMKQFPMPDDYVPAPASDFVDIEIEAVPSRVLQTKTVTPTLRHWISQGYVDSPDSFDGAINTAIVLPDDALLLPALLSLPPETGAVNITMGLSYHSTPFCALLSALVSMQLRARSVRDVYHFYYEDLINVVSHPHLRLIAGRECDAIKRKIRRNNLFTVSSAELIEDFPRLAFIFKPVKDCNDVVEVHAYTVSLIDCLIEEFRRVEGTPGVSGSSGLEIELLTYYREELDRLAELIGKYHIEMRDTTYFGLFERLLSSKSANLKGTPLHGLQMMGVLETRALDFDNVIIMSLNERMFPRKSYANTLIPNNLRAGYGMPTTDRAEWDYAYHFYRLLTRARHVKLIYDSRVNGTTSRYGEVSRYLTQLRHLHNPAHLRFTSVDPSASSPEQRIITIQKTGAVADDVRRLLAGGDLRLSATALKTYKKCPLAFYLEYIKGYRADNGVTCYMDPSTFGTIVHAVAENLYNPYAGRRINSELIDSFIKNKEVKIVPVIKRMIMEHYYRGARFDGDLLPAEGTMQVKVIDHLITGMLRAERDTFCKPEFIFTAAEEKVASPDDGCWHVAPGLDVNFTMSIDRVDTCLDGSLRFIDYKTGGDKVAAPSVAELFSRRRSDFDAIFQLMVYCSAYASMRGFEGAIQPVVYPFKNLAADGIKPITIAKEPVMDYREFVDEFNPLIAELVGEIFNPDVPFSQSQYPDHACKYCKFINLCGRTVKES